MNPRAKRRQEGSALILVLCVMVVVVMLSLTLFATYSVVTRSGSSFHRKEQYRIGASTILDLLIEEITSPDENELQQQLKEIGTPRWPSVENQKTPRIYKLNDMEAFGETKVELYWEGEKVCFFEKEGDALSDEEILKFQSIALYVKVTCGSDEDVYSVCGSFRPIVQYKSELNDKGENVATWNGWRWSYEGRL